MKADDLKNKMIKLWEDTFHDSHAYVSLIFDNYFDPDLVEYYEEDGKLVSALLGIPYEFGNGKAKMKALYLCGLATVSEYRHRGIMNALLEEINRKAAEKGFVFTFLIPANDSLINYYYSRKYETAIYRIEDCYTELHDFVRNYMSNIDKSDERIYVLKSKLFESISTKILNENDTDYLRKIVDFIYNSENGICTYASLLHSKKDIEIIVKENALSGGKIFVSYNKEELITGVAFTTIDERKRVHVPKVYYEDKGSLYRLLDCVKRTFSESPISLYCYPEECDRKSLWENFYGASGGSYGVVERVYNVSHHAKPYGMVRILDLYEILKFIAKDRSDLKFSILVKKPSDSEIVLKYDISEGNVRVEEIRDDILHQCAKDKNLAVLNEREFVEILFRKKGSSNMIQEAFDVPRLPLNMSLLLD